MRISPQASVSLATCLNRGPFIPVLPPGPGNRDLAEANRYTATEPLALVEAIPT